MADVGLDSFPERLSRSEAAARGLKQYFNGKPCPHGHAGWRYVSSGRCIECADAGAKVFRKNNPEIYRDLRKKYKDRENAQSRAWHAANRERALVRMRNWYEENKDLSSERNKAWRENNREAHLAIKRNRRARVSAAPGRHTRDDVLTIYRAQKGRCACCRVKVGDDYHVDHIVPLARGGTNWPANLQILCARCNVAKKDKDPIEFMQSKGLLL